LTESKNGVKSHASCSRTTTSPEETANSAENATTTT
jgi:hypothetical protein